MPNKTITRTIRIAILTGLVSGLPLQFAHGAERAHSPQRRHFRTHSVETARANTSHSGIKKTRDNRVILNFQDADIQAVIKTVSQMTGTNFLLDPRVKGKITIISAKPVSRADAYQIFLSALRAQGFTATPGPGGLVTVVPVGEGRERASVNSRVRAHAGDEMVTQVFVLQHGDASQLVPLLRPLMAPTSQIAAYAPANALIITDYASNVRRLRRIVAEVDQPTSLDTTIIPLKNASAVDIADLLSQVETARGESIRRGPARPMMSQQLGGVVVVPDPRTNSLLVRTSNPAQLAQIESLVSKLDTSATPSGRTRVVYLQNANAENLAKILSGLLEAKKASRRRQSPNQIPATVEADKATNSLIISASDAVYNNLRSVIEKLDIRRAQVYVEALITEVQVNKASELGFQWASGAPAGQGTAAGIVNFPQTNGTGIGQVALNPSGLASAGGLSLAYLGPQITLPDGTVVNSLAALARALEQENIANVLSTPDLLTLDNAEAKIMVGQNVPFVTGSYAQPTGTNTVVNPFQTIDRKDVGLTLKIKPQISQGGTIKMNVSEEVSTISNTPVAGASGLILNKRTLKTKVIVENGHTVVLGGLMEDNVQNTRQRVPLLGSIPILGALFRYDSRQKTKTNLMIFLRPTIIRSSADSSILTMDRYRRLLGRSSGILPDQLPTIQEFRPKPVIVGKDTTKKDSSTGPKAPKSVSQPQAQP